MNRIYTLLLLAVSLQTQGQQHQCAAAKIKSLGKSLQQSSSINAQEHKYDMKFVHLDLNVEDTTKYISGSSKMIAQVTAAALDTYVVVLHQNLSIDSVWFNGSKHIYNRVDSMVQVVPAIALPVNSTFTAQVWYKGTPPVGGSALGDGFTSTVDWSYGYPVTWSLSESFVAYHWWPCKQVLTDKIDSSWVFVTTDSTNMAGSNGLLENVITTGGKKRYEWKSRYPIDYYLISVAVAEYKEYNIYAKPLYLNDSILVQNFVYANALNSNYWKNNEKPLIDKIPSMIELYSRLYGMYPFYKEKYGHCMAAIGGGMEHQTMSTMGTMANLSLNAHELAHQWWGDNVTCQSWSDIFMNEGFASYSQLVALEYLSPSNLLTNINIMHNNVMSQPGGSIHFTGADTMNTSRIFDGRLSYYKGAAILRSLQFVTNNDSAWFNTLRDFQHAFTGQTASVQDFMDFYHTSTGIDPTQFFQQWYYGEGYPTFTTKYNYDNTKMFFNVTQTTSMPSKTPLFITPVEYRIFRQGLPDTVVRLMHTQASENYTLPVTGTVTGVITDDKNWILNKGGSATRDVTLGVQYPDAEITKITISPNPSDGVFHLNNPEHAEGTVEISDLTGRKLYEQDLRLPAFTLRDYPAGVYLIKISAHGRARTEKLIRN